MRYTLLVTFLLIQSNAVRASDLDGPVKVFILAGQSNMEGQGVVDLEGDDYNQGKGTLKMLLGDPVKGHKLRHLLDASGRWTIRHDVQVHYQRENAPLLSGPLGVGYTVYGDQHHFGPELQFGHIVGDYFEEPILLIKTAWGGKSLYQDFRPPSSGGQVGPYYQRMIKQTREALATLEQTFPGFNRSGYALTGFVWYHGWNDAVDAERAVPEYEQNLVNLIRDVRRDLDAPRLPVVIGEMTGPWVQAEGQWDLLRKAQAAAAARTEFAGTVAFVETHAFVRKAEESPNPGHGHHEFGNAETYFLVGDAIGKGMLKLLSPPVPVDAEPSKPVSHTNREVEGWTIRVDDRLLHGPEAALGTQTLRFLEAKLSDIKAVVPVEKLRKLQSVTIVLDLSHGNLRTMQYHPSADWLTEHGYSSELAKCVHIPQAADLPTKRSIREQPWVVLHELAHAYHDQVLGFDEPRIKEAYKQYRESGHGDAALLYDGSRVRHYGLTDEKEFFAEMTEAYFGCNDFFPFNWAELKESEPEITKLLEKIWE